MNTALKYYAIPGPMTDAGSHAALFEELPTDISTLVKVIQGVMVHIFWAEAYELQLSDVRKSEVNLRRVDLQLARLLELDPRPLSEARSPERRLVGNCRDFSVMMAAILRHQGVPARARCGFGTYFLPDHFEDHWVCEVWNAEQGRWVLVDAQLDAMMADVLKLDFDPLDTPRNRFIVGGQAWQWCRAGKEDPQKFGIFDMHGMAFIAGDLMRDFLAFNKVEILPWDGGWGYITDQCYANIEDGSNFGPMDRLAALTLAGDAAFEEIRDLYENDPNFHVPVDCF